MRFKFVWVTVLCGLAWTACGDDDADELGVGAQCAGSDDCSAEGQSCLANFKGGYCGVKDCAADADCPANAACVSHTDGVNYCFRICTDKSECNENRDAENESNCSSNIEFADGPKTRKACVPPSSGE